MPGLKPTEARAEQEVSCEAAIAEADWILFYMNKPNEYPTLGLSRRAFCRDAITFLAASTLPGQATNRAFTASGPHMDFPTSPYDRMAVGSWPFRAYIDGPENPERNRNLPGMDLKDFAANIVEKLNVRNIEPYNFHFSSLDQDYLTSFRQNLARTKSQVVNIAVDINESFYDADRSTRKKAVAYAKTWVNAAVNIGAPSIRTSIARATNSPPNLKRTVETVREVVDYAAEKNIVVNLENDGLVNEDAFFLVRVIETVRHPYLHALPDFANSMLSGDPEFNYRAVQALFQHAYCICHAKDGDVDDNGKMIKVDLKKSFEILKASGYRGYCSVEYSGLGDPYEPTRELIERSVQYLS